jgi:hypothetical protein
MNFDDETDQRMFLRYVGEVRKRTEHKLNDENSKDYITCDEIKTYIKMS